MSLNSQLSSACHRSTRLLPYLKPSVAPTASKREPILLHSPAVTSSPDSSWTPGSLLHTLRPHELPPPSIPQWAPSGLRALVPEAAQPQISPTASSSSPAAHPVSPTASKRPCLPMPLKGGFPALPFLPTPLKGFPTLPFHRITGHAVLIYSLASPTVAQARQARDLV